MAMTDEQIERYSRHIILKEVGAKGQKKLLKGKVLIIGAGGLGAPAAMYLAAAGVGTIGIVDADEADHPQHSRYRKSKGKISKGNHECHESGCGSKNLPDVRRRIQHPRTDSRI